MFVARKRATLLYPSGPSDDPFKYHLFVILTEPYGPARQIVMVPICSIVDGQFHDPTCLINVGDHPFIRHPSYVAYAKGREQFAQDLANGVANGGVSDRGLIDEAVFARIVVGAPNSKFTKPFIKKALR